MEPTTLVAIAFCVFAFGFPALTWAELIPNHEQLVHIITLAVAASTLAHGLSAAPLASVYGRWVERLRATEPEGSECRSVPDLPVRIRLHEQRSEGESTP